MRSEHTSRARPTAESVPRKVKKPERSRRYVRSSSPSALAGHARAVPQPELPLRKPLTISEPANRAVRPAYAKLDEGCSDRPSRASMHRGWTMGKHKLGFVAFDSAKEKHAVAIADD